MKVTSEMRCPLHEVKHEVDVPEQEYRDWLDEKIYVQDIPGLDVHQREILLTGMCKVAWDSMFAKSLCEAMCDGSSHPGLYCR